MERPGILSFIKLSGVEEEVFLDYLYNTKGVDYLEFVKMVMGDQFLKFIDLFSGEVIRVPTREETYKIINYVKIYVYCKDRGFSDESIDAATKIFSRRRNSIIRIINKVNSVIEKEEQE